MREPAEAVARERLRPSRDGRLVPYAALAFGGFGAALVAGQPAFAGFAVPFALALAVGLRRTEPVEVTARLTLEPAQVIEGDRVAGRLELTWDTELEAEVLLQRVQGLEPADEGPEAEGAADEGAPGGSLASPSADAPVGEAGPPEPERWTRTPWAFAGPRRRATVPLKFRAQHWGRHGIGEVWVRLTAPWGLFSWTGKLVPNPGVRVLPRREHLDALLEPPSPQAVGGSHVSPRTGHGHDFAELRPYAPGDRLRDLNWKATARRRRPFVNRYHPELAGEVVVVVDALDDGSIASRRALGRGARMAWALISSHLRANDRVGVAALGGSARWLPPAGGHVARYKLLETLLSIGGDAATGTGAAGAHRTPAIPRSALVVVLTTLQDERTLGALRAWRGRGRSVVVALLDPTDFGPAPASQAETLGRRLWKLELEGRRRALEELAIPVVPVSPDDPVDAAVAVLRAPRPAAVLRGRR